eukprot:GHVR01091034.1.p1 GENE.GHVR01091034.1~~GHVR01091034.1.p1  ORF type:complete len:127 (-),score=38.46 GHVR01091034.1:336-716(-)
MSSPVPTPATTAASPDTPTLSPSIGSSAILVKFVCVYACVSVCVFSISSALRFNAPIACVCVCVSRVFSSSSVGCNLPCCDKSSHTHLEIQSLYASHCRCTVVSRFGSHNARLVSAAVAAAASRNI